MRFIYVSITLIAVFLAGVLISLFIGEERAVDYYRTYYTQLKTWLEGTSVLYDNDLGMYNPPWLMWILSPVIIVPYSLQVAIMRGLSVAILAYATIVTTQKMGKDIKILAVIFSLINIFTVTLYFTGQIDAIPLLGLVIGLHFQNWVAKGIGYTLLALKPPNFWILGAFIFILEVKNKGWLQAIKGLIIPFFTFLISFLIHGNWLERWYKNYTNSPPFDYPKTTFWRAMEALQVPSLVALIIALLLFTMVVYTAFQVKNQNSWLLLLLVTTYTLTFYNLSYQLVVLMVFVLPSILAWRTRLGIAVYALSYFGLLRAAFIPLDDPYYALQLFWFDMLWVLVMFGMVVWQILEKKKLAVTR
jgi:hypothetical protein